MSADDADARGSRRARENQAVSVAFGTIVPVEPVSFALREERRRQNPSRREPEDP
jgi:hypothetical protein